MPWWSVDVVKMTSNPWFPDKQTVVGTIRALWTTEKAAQNYISRAHLDGKRFPNFIGVALESDVTVMRSNRPLLPYESPLASLVPGGSTLQH